MFAAAPLHLRHAGVAHPTVVLASLRTLDDKELGFPEGGAASESGQPSVALATLAQLFCQRPDARPDALFRFAGRRRRVLLEREGSRSAELGARPKNNNNKQKKNFQSLGADGSIYLFIYLSEILGDVLFFFLLPFNPINFPDVFFRCQMSGSEAVKA